MNDTFPNANCEKLQASFRLYNVQGFIPLITRLYLETPNSNSSDAPIAVTPQLNTDARIPLTAPFRHDTGLLFFETFLSYQNVSADDLDELVSRLSFEYQILDCRGTSTIFSEYDYSKKIESKKLIYFIKSIDII